MFKVKLTDLVTELGNQEGRKISIKELSMMIGVSSLTLQNVKSGRGCNLETLYKICDFFGKQPNEVLEKV